MTGQRPARADTTPTVMSFNIWGGGANEGKPVDETMAAIRAAGAALFGEKSPEADLVSTPWPSDHRAITATVRF